MFSRMELKEIRKFLSRVYPGVADQDNLWNLIRKLDNLISKGKPNAKKQSGHRRSDRGS